MNKEDGDEALQKFCEELLDITQSLLGPGLKFDQSNHFKFLCICFLHKQIVHMKNILLLAPSPDIKLIAKSMLEGKIQIQWANIDPINRGRQFRAFAFVHDWRLMQSQLKEGVKVPEKIIHDTNWGIKEYEDLLLTPKNKRKKENGQELDSDPYIKTWSGKNIKELFTESDAELNNDRLRRINYKDLNAWSHWGTEGLAPYLKLDLDSGAMELTYKCVGDNLKSVYAIAFQSLVTSATIFSEEFETNQSKIDNLTNRYLSFHGEI